MDTISLDTAVAITGISRSTLWRRVTDGSIGRCGKDSRNRAMLALADVLPLVTVPLDEEDARMLVRADAGDAAAQSDVGALFAQAALGAAGKTRGGGQLYTRNPLPHASGRIGRGRCDALARHPARGGAVRG